MNESDPGVKVGIVVGESGTEYQTQTKFDPALDRETTQLVHEQGPQPVTLAEGE
jgi:hypothetical protein